MFRFNHGLIIFSKPLFKLIGRLMPSRLEAGTPPPPPVNIGSWRGGWVGVVADLIDKYHF